MKKLAGLTTAVALLFTLSQASQAAMVEFDLTNPTSAVGQNGYYADAYSYQVGGVTLNVTGYSNGGNRYRPWEDLDHADIGLFGGGLGVESRGLSHTVDNMAADYDFLLFSFDQEVTLSNIELGYIGDSWYLHDSDLSYASLGDTTWSGSIFDAQLGENAANPESISSDTWLIGAFHPYFSEAQDWLWDGFKISGLSVDVNAVPLPAAIWFLISGLGMVAYLRRRREASPVVA